MKRLFAILLITCTTLSLTSFQNFNTDKSRVDVYFNKHTGFTELVIIKANLEKKHIILNYEKIQYNKAGELIALSFSVDCQDGFSGAASTDKIGNDKTFGFYRDYSKNAESPFGTGAL